MSGRELDKMTALRYVRTRIWVYAERDRRADAGMKENHKIWKGLEKKLPSLSGRFSNDAPGTWADENILVRPKNKANTIE